MSGLLDAQRRHSGPRRQSTGAGMMGSPARVNRIGMRRVQRGRCGGGDLAGARPGELMERRRIAGIARVSARA